MIYARGVADTVGPGATRLLLLAPALCVNVAAPLLVLDPDAEPLFSAIAIANFAWWTNFKLIALAAGRGQLTGPALSAPTFLALAALPVKFADERDERVPRGDSDRTRVEKKKKTKRARRADPHTARDACVGFACKLALLSWCVSFALPALESVSHHEDSTNQTETERRLRTYAKNATHAVALYACLGALFDLGAVVAAVVFGATLARHFDLPFLATSFGDFWGARWNLIAGASLRDAVYAPITEGRFFRAGKAEENERGEKSLEASLDDADAESAAKKKKARRVVGVFACFAVSGAMHEFVLWALVGRSSKSPTRAIGWEWFAFFLSQAPLVSLEYAARKKKAVRKKKKKTAPNPRGAVFFVARRAAQNGAFLVAQLALANALFFPPVARNALDARIVADVRRVLGVQTP